MRLHVTIKHTLSGLTGEMTFTVKRVGDQFEVIPGVFWSSNSIWPKEVIDPLAVLLVRQAVVFAVLPGRRVFYSTESGMETYWRKL